MKTLVFRFKSNNVLITSVLSETEEVINLAVDSRKATFDRASEKLIVDNEGEKVNVEYTEYEGFDVQGIKDLMNLVTFACRDQKKEQFYNTISTISTYVMRPFSLKLTYDTEDNRSWRFFIATAIKGFTATELEIRVAREGFMNDSIEGVQEFKDYKFKETFLRDGNEAYSKISFINLAQTYQNVFNHKAEQIRIRKTAIEAVEALGANVNMFARSPLEIYTAIKEGKVTIDQVIEWHTTIGGNE